MSLKIHILDILLFLKLNIYQVVNKKINIRRKLLPNTGKLFRHSVKMYWLYQISGY